ncbi:hypothetical protein [Dawidia soli]|uniref:Uncharacterized protein n=1 Tax=Dawidia soli TaxID=2782352 RepID=A0AAP2GI37_9BACT|nr:hypothetical protein [Dawidia soli]MBT1687065.1 hypothetical protein [Dawidia soli]
MLFRLTEVVEQVRYADFSEGSLIYIDRRGTVICKDDNGTCVIAENMKDFRADLSYIFCFNKMDNLEVYRKGEKIKHFDGTFCRLPIYQNADHVFVFQEVDDVEKFIRLDANLHAVTYAWDDNFPSDIRGEYFFVRQGALFSCHRLSDGQELWTMNVYEVSGETEGSVMYDRILLDGKLFISLVTGVVLCLNVATGEIIEKIPFDKSRIQLHNGLIYGTGGRELGILDPKTLTWRTVDFSETLKGHNFHFQANCFIVQGDELYFMNRVPHYTSEGAHVIGVVKISTRELLWHIDIPVTEGYFWVEDMGVKGDKLYVLAQEAVLHIFERNVLS